MSVTNSELEFSVNFDFGYLWRSRFTVNPDFRIFRRLGFTVNSGLRFFRRARFTVNRRSRRLLPVLGRRQHQPEGRAHIDRALTLKSCRRGPNARFDGSFESSVTAREPGPEGPRERAAQPGPRVDPPWPSAHSCRDSPHPMREPASCSRTCSLRPLKPA